MERKTRAVRRALYGLVLAAIGQFIFDGIDIFEIRSVPVRAAEVILALVLLFGIVPGLYISVILRRLSDRARGISLRRARILAIGIPLLLLVIQAYYVVGDLNVLQRIDDPRVQASLLYGLAMALIQLAILALNAVDVSRSSNQQSSI